MSNLTLEDEDGAGSDNEEEEGVAEPKELPEYACKYVM